MKLLAIILAVALLLSNYLWWIFLRGFAEATSERYKLIKSVITREQLEEINKKEVEL